MQDKVVRNQWVQVKQYELILMTIISLDIHSNVSTTLLKLHSNIQYSIVTTIAILFIGLCHSDVFQTHPCKNTIVMELELHFSMFLSLLEVLSLVDSAAPGSGLASLLLFHCFWLRTYIGWCMSYNVMQIAV